jgi:hypothetical protein
MTTIVNLPIHVNRKLVLMWLNDHVGAIELHDEPFHIQGEGWRWRTITYWKDPSQTVLSLSFRVEFDAHISLDVTTQFALTWG